MSSDRPSLSEKDQALLLAEARACALQELSGSSTPPAQPPQVSGTYGGVFVTFWNGDRLRGCMGSFAQTNDIIQATREVTKSSLNDPRFHSERITLDELSGLSIEISVLSDLIPTQDPASLVPGTHGIVIRRGSHTGCFLPQVATQYGWSVEEFLTQCCVGKANLEPHAWRDPQTQIFLFTAEVLSDNPVTDVASSKKHREDRKG